MSIESLDDVRPGDIMISGMSTAPTKAIVYGGHLLLREHFRIGKFVAGHAGIITPAGKVVEAVSSGARERDLRPSDWSASHAYFRLPEDYPNQHLDVATIARAMIGTPYSLASYAYLAAYLAGVESEFLADRIDRRKRSSVLFLHRYNGYLPLPIPVEAICSVLVDQSWTLTGKTVVQGTKPQVVTPGMLTAQLWITPDVVRGMAKS